MTVWQLLGIVCSAGGLGGLINALLQRKGSPPPQTRLWLWRTLKAMLIGAVAAGLTWALYGPLNTTSLFPFKPLDTSALEHSLTLGTLGAACIQGLGGATVLESLSRKSAEGLSATSAARGDGAHRPK